MFSERLQELIDHIGLTQEQLANEINTSPSNVSRWINGKVVPGKMTIRKIVEVTECRHEWLADGTGKMFPETKSRWGIPLSKHQEIGLELFSSTTNFSSFISNLLIHIQKLVFWHCQLIIYNEQLTNLVKLVTGGGCNLAKKTIQSMCYNIAK